jgi:hypothetical protein
MCESLPLTAFRRFALQIALGLALAESALFFFVWRLEMLVEPAAGRQSALAFILLGSVVTLQAMVVVGVAWAIGRRLAHDGGRRRDRPHAGAPVAPLAW